jgi:hypothetical protein
LVLIVLLSAKISRGGFLGWLRRLFLKGERTGLAVGRGAGARAARLLLVEGLLRLIAASCGVEGRLADLLHIFKDLVGAFQFVFEDRTGFSGWLLFFFLLFHSNSI